jgi:hypothetical protein
MRLITKVFLALQSFDRPATRRELERESGLSKDDVRTGLKGLTRRSLIVAEVLPRRRGTYRLVPGAVMPEELRGKFIRDAAFCERLRRAHLGYHAASAPTPQPMHSAPIPQQASSSYSAASPPTPSNAPGGARLVVKGMLEASAFGHSTAFPAACALAEVWKKR